MKSIVILFTMLAASSAFADGFVCRSTEGDLNAKVYNHVHAQLGTRTAAVLVLSNPAAEDGNKTIAKFTDGEETLMSKSATFTAAVDQVPAADKAGKFIIGSSLTEIDTITLDVYYDYNAPAPAGSQVGGQVTIQKDDGTTITRQIECTRYLKNPE